MQHNAKTYDLVHLLITNRCNLCCEHCLANSGKPDPGEFTTAEMVNVVQQLNTIDYKDIHFEGGEPFYREDFPVILGSFSTLSNATVITNGTIPYDSRFDVLKEKHIDGVMVSMDNFGRPSRGRYDQILPTLISYRKHGLPVKIRTTLTKQNINFMDEICKIALESGIGVVRFGAYKQIGRGSQEKVRAFYALDKSAYINIFDELVKLFDRYPQLVIKFSAPASFTHENDGYKLYMLAKSSAIGRYSTLLPCYAFHKQFNVFSDGSVTQCNESCSPVVLGNLREDSLKHILKNEKTFMKDHWCDHGHLLISSDCKSFNMQ
jgi:radical SAM protein with 4Fe4S-binding SPASM domain